MAQPEYGTDAVEGYMQHRETLTASTAAELNRQRFGQQTADAPDAPKRLEDLTAPPEVSAAGIDRAKAVAKDVGQGIVELPRAAVTGSIGAVNETLQLSDDAANYINDKLGTPRGEFPKVPAPDDPTSNAGMAEKSIVQFLVGFAGAGKLKGVANLRKFGAVGDIAEPTVKAALADFAVFDPHQANLANLVQEFPQLKNPVTDYLASKPEDTNAEGRFKAALTGMASGVVIEGLLRSLKTLRRAGTTKQLLESEVRPSVAEGAFDSILGDVNEPLAKMSQKGFAMRAKKNLDAQGGATPLSGQSLTGELFHGSPQRIAGDAPKNSHYAMLNRYGQGFNATDSAELAQSYRDQPQMIKSRGAEPTLYEAKAKPGVELFDLEKPIPTEVRQWAERFPNDVEGRALKGAKTVRDFMDNVRKLTVESGGTNDQIQETFGELQTILEEKGYRGYKHRSDDGKANVSLFWYPETDVTVKSAAATGDKAAMARGMEALRAPVEEPETLINWSRIDAPEDVENVMQRMADTFKKSNDTARRGVQTFEEIKLNAEQVNAWKILSERRVGQPLNAEQSLAARNLWAASGQKLAEVAQAVEMNPSDVNVFAFRKMLAIHQEIQKQVMAARTETARALASWRITSGAGQAKLAEIQAALATNGGKDTSAKFAIRLAALARNNMLQEFDAAVQKSVGARTKEAFIEAWINGLLSGPKTHLVNAVSNASVIFQTMGERAVAAQIARVLGDEGSVQLGESMALWSGMVGSFGDAFRYAGKTFRTGESGFGAGKVELPRDRAISAEALGIAESGWFGKTVDVIGAGVNVPVRALGAADEFYKTIGYRAELQALALRRASADVRAGKVPADQLKAQVAKIVDNPPESLHLDAVDAAAYRTFTNQTSDFATKLSEIANNHAWVKFVLPFVRTPANIMAYSFERTPLAPLMSGVRADIKAGGARRDIAYARMATGTSIMLWATDLAQKGQITGRGPRNPAQREAMQRTGWQPYSWKVGERYYAFNRLDPMGTTLSLAADMTEILANDEYGVERDRSVEQVAIATAMAAGNNVFNKTYLTGIATAMEALTQGGGYAEAWFKGMAGSLVPTGVAEVAKYQDPYAHAASSMLDAIYARTPGYSTDVPYRHDLWGRQIDFQSGFGGVYDAVSPIYTRRENPEPIDTEILRLEASIQDAPKATSFKSELGKSVDVNLEAFPAAYQRYVVLAGNELKDPVWRMGCKDFLNAVVGDKHPMSDIYWRGALDDGPDGGKAQWLASVINKYRDRARTQLLREFPDLRDAVNGRATLKRERKLNQLYNPSTP